MAWYLWAILGVLAIVFEMVSPTFFALFVGIGFLCSATFAYFLPDALMVQIITALVGMFVGLWVFRRRKLGDSPNCKIGQTDEFFGTKGKVIKILTDHEKAEAIFSEPVFGRTKWSIVSSNGEDLQLNDLVEVVTVYSNHLNVKKISN